MQIFSRLDTFLLKSHSFIQNPIGNVNTQGLPDIQNLGDSIGNAKNQALADEPFGNPIEIVNTQGLPVIQNRGDSIGNVNTQGLPDIQNLGDSIGNAKNQVLADEPLVESILVYNTQGLPVIRKKLGDSIWYVKPQGLLDLQNLGDSIGNMKNQALADEPSGDPIEIVNTQGLPDESLCPSKAQTHLGDMKTHLERFPVQPKFNGSWLFDMDVVAFKTLYEEYMKGNKLVKGDFNMYLVNRILEKVERETGEYLTRDSIQRRLIWHANSVRDVRALANKAKFVWNAEECKLDADEEAWKEEFRENPSSIFLYNIVYPFYDYIVHLFPSFREE